MHCPQVHTTELTANNRFGDQAIAAFHLHGAVGTETIAATITEDAEWFQGLLKHFDDLWEKAQTVPLDE